MDHSSLGPANIKALLCNETSQNPFKRGLKQWQQRQNIYSMTCLNSNASVTSQMRLVTSPLIGLINFTIFPLTSLAREK